eukprot:GILJ01010894.1.p1 GENE.GILJ01010894.1~~GILJ01010894.1.p1  ORF type:complete len:537 (-),score=62.62 GILJ01010894.1:253-1863(-)
MTSSPTFLEQNNNYPAVSRFMHEQGFSQGLYSDVKVVIGGRQLPLHRLVLHRSPYFAALLSGPWKDSQCPEIVLSPEDSYITQEALRYALESMYSDTFEVEKRLQYEALAAASFLQLPLLESRCCEAIQRNLSGDEINRVVAMSERYMNKRLQKACQDWLRVHLVKFSESHSAEFGRLPLHMFAQLLSTEGLWIASEMDRYRLTVKYVQQRRGKEGINLPKTAPVQPVDEELASMGVESSGTMDQETAIQNMADEEKDNPEIRDDSNSTSSDPFRPTGTKRPLSTVNLMSSSNPSSPTVASKRPRLESTLQFDFQNIDMLIRSDHTDLSDEDVGSLFALLRLHHIGIRNLEEVEKDGFVSAKNIQQIYQYNMKLMCGSLSLNEVNSTQSVRIGFEFKDLVSMDLNACRRGPKFRFAGSEWELRLFFEQPLPTDPQNPGQPLSKENIPLMCSLRRLRLTEDDGTTPAGFKNINRFHRVKYRYIYPINGATAKEVEQNFAHGMEQRGRFCSLSFLKAKNFMTNDTDLCMILCMSHYPC